MYPDAVLRSNGLLLIIYLPSKACLRICSWRSRWHTELLLHLYEQLQSSLGCASSWALFVGLRCQGFSSALPAPASLLLLSSLLLCRWSLEFQFLEHIESKGLKGSEKRRAWSKEILGQYRPCFLLEPGGGGEIWIGVFYLPTVSHSVHGLFPEMTPTEHQLVGTPESLWLPIPENSFQTQPVGCLSILVYEGRHLNLFCLYIVPVNESWGEALYRASRQKPFLNQKLCSPNCQVYLVLVFIQPKMLDVNMIQE